MGQGIDLARDDAPLHTEVLDNLKDQMLIALVKRYGPVVTFPVAEIDATGDSVLLMGFDAEGKTFTFEARPKQ